MVASDLTYIDHVVVEEQPEVVTLDDADVVSSVRPTAAVDYHSHQVVHTIRIHSVVRLQPTILG